MNLSKMKHLVTGKEAEIVEKYQLPCAVGGKVAGVHSVL